MPNYREIADVLSVGTSATVQDQGRPGWAALGVGRSGAFDPAAAAMANRLVGNDESAALLEVVLGGLAIRARTAMLVALVGAPCGLAGHRPMAWGAPIALAAGQILRLGVPPRGLRCWLAIRGGVAAQAVLGSRSRDALSGLGPRPLAPGDTLASGASATGPVPPVDWSPPTFDGSAAPAVRVDPGPRLDWFDANAWAALARGSWTVRADSDRIGIRLDGPPLARRHIDELPSEGMLPGAIQIPPDGRPIIMGPDSPVTGGYPVIGVVPESDFRTLAQLRPGDGLSLVAAS